MASSGMCHVSCIVSCRVVCVEIAPSTSILNPNTPHNAPHAGLSEVTAPMALAAGARGVGVGQAVTKCPSEAEMAQRIKTIARAMGIAKVEA